jgi:hypothetical protein
MLVLPPYPPHSNTRLKLAFTDEYKTDHTSVPRHFFRLTSAQPSDDHIKFARQLVTNNVALKNVVVVTDNDKFQLTGSVLVKNMTFEKNVFIRFTLNNWESYIDQPCTHKQACTSNLAQFSCLLFSVLTPYFAGSTNLSLQGSENRKQISILFIYVRTIVLH